MHITFDTLAMVQRLESKGFTRQQSEEVINVVRDVHDDLVTKKDFDAGITDLRRDMGSLRKDMDTGFLFLKKEMFIGIGIMIASATGIIATLLKLF